MAPHQEWDLQREEGFSVDTPPADTREGVVKPWLCANAQFKVIAPSKERKNRRKELQRMKGVAEEGLNSTPYVKIQWEDGTTDHALFDTGAQWTLISTQMLTERERELMEDSSLFGQGVSGEKIPVVGEVWRSVKLGSLDFSNQRFVVVDKMVCPIILGIDFWSRIELLSFDFNRRMMTIGGTNEEIPLLAHPQQGEMAMAEEEIEKEVLIAVLVRNDVTIPAGNERLLECYVPRMKKGRDYLVQPTTSEDDLMVSTPYGLVEGNDAKIITIKVANLNGEEATMKKGDWIATLDGDRWVTDSKAGSAFKNTSRKSDFDWREMCCKNLDKNKTSQLTDLLLKKHKTVFYDGKTLPIVQVGVEHTIKLKEDSPPTAFRPRRLSRELADEVREHIDKLLKEGVIRESNSPWASPIVCARKADGSLRLVIDYRCTNAKSVTATLHPIPLIEDLLDRLAKAKYFSILDAKSGYHQMPLKEEDSEVTAFVVPWGHYEFAERTPFGLKGAGYSFQRMMSAILGDSNFIEALCYLDDILVWGETWEIHMKRLKRVELSKIEEAGLALSASKCKFGLKEVSYLGCKIKEGMLSVNEQRVEQMRKIERPGNVRELRRALVGAFAYVQRWLPGLSEIAKPLYDAITGKPYVRLKWTTEMDIAFSKMKEMISNAVSLNLPDMERRFILVTDCSNVAAGAMLSQECVSEPGLLKPVAFYHHTLNVSEQKYSATEKELLAVVLSVKKFRVYLGKDFTLITDHQALKWLESLNPENETGRRGRWLDFLQQFSMVIVPKKGKSPAMSIADYLSRVTLDGSCPQKVVCSAQSRERTDSMDTAGDNLISRSEIIDAQARDQGISAIIDALKNDLDLNPGRSDSDNWRTPSGSNDPSVKQLWKYRERLLIDREGILRLAFHGGRRSGDHPFGRNEKNRIVIPKTLGKKIMSLVHNSATGAHMGSSRTWVRARNNFWWLDMKGDIEKYVKGCALCSLNKHVNHPNRAPMPETSIPDKPLEELMIDFLGPFQRARTHQFRYVLQIQDVLSRFILLIPCQDATAETAASCLVDRWVCLFGAAKKLRSDRGTHFTADTFEEVCRLLGIKHKLGSPEHPESQGQVERQNQLLNHVRCLCENDIESWPEALFKVQCSHNASRNAATGMSPARMIWEER